MMALEIIAIAIVLFLTGCIGRKAVKKQLLFPTQICERQGDILKKIQSGVEFDEQEEIDILSQQFVVDTSLFGYNAVHWNNIAVRNHLLLSVLYNAQADYDKSKEEFGKARELIDFNVIASSVWAEGPSYYLYTEEMIDLYLDCVDSSQQYLLDVKKNMRQWIEDYMTPDSMIPPIGEARRQKWDGEYSPEPAMRYNTEETLFKNDNLYILVRHPSRMHKYIWSGHTHFDIGNVVVYYRGKRVLYHVGYPGYKQKMKGLWDIRNQNSLYMVGMNEPMWRFGYYRLESIDRKDNSIRLEYIINGKQVVRIVSFEKNRVRITDTGTDGINLNFNMDRCDINVVEGRNMRLVKGYHAEEDSKIVENNRVVVSDDNGITSVEVALK